MTRFALCLLVCACSGGTSVSEPARSTAPAAKPSAVAEPSAAAPPTPAAMSPRYSTPPAHQGAPYPLWTRRVESDDPLPCDAPTPTGVHGIVRVSDGTVLHGARVELELGGESKFQTTTDKAGCYFFAAVPAGRVRVYVRHDTANGTSPVLVPERGLARVDGELELR